MRCYLVWVVVAIAVDDAYFAMKYSVVASVLSELMDVLVTSFTESFIALYTVVHRFFSFTTITEIVLRHFEKWW